MQKNFKVPALLFNSFNQVLTQTFVLVFFISYFFVYLRIIGVLTKEYATVDLNFFFVKIQERMFISNERIFIFFIITLLICSIICIIFIINYYIFFEAKKCFLKLHYFLFSRYIVYNFFLTYIPELEYFIIQKFNINNFFLMIIMKYGFKFFVICLILENIFLENCVLYLGWLPYYSLYYFIYNIYEFILLRFTPDFEIAMLNSYYKEIDFFIENNRFKLNEYLKFLFLGYSKYKFKDCIYLEYPELIGDNWIILNTFRYTINKYPKDFYSRIRKVKPKYN
jgi:hypothetical protein